MRSVVARMEEKVAQAIAGAIGEGVAQIVCSRGSAQVGCVKEIDQEALPLVSVLVKPFSMDSIATRIGEFAVEVSMGVHLCDDPTMAILDPIAAEIERLLMRLSSDPQFADESLSLDGVFSVGGVRADGGDVVVDAQDDDAGQTLVYSFAVRGTMEGV